MVGVRLSSILLCKINGQHIHIKSLTPISKKRSSTNKECVIAKTTTNFTCSCTAYEILYLSAINILKKKWIAVESRIFRWLVRARSGSISSEYLLRERLPVWRETHR